MRKSFESDRLTIRPTTEADAELVYELMNTPKFIQFVGDRGINSCVEAKNYIKTKMLPQLHSLGYSSYTLVTKVDGSKIGTCGLYNREGVDGIDIGFGLLPAYERLGYAYEAASILLQAAFTDFGIMEIKAITAKDNVSSQRLLEKLGLALIGTTTLPNDTEEILLYTIDKKKYQERIIENG